MTQSSNEQIIKKWSDVLDKVGLSEPKSDWLEEYVKLHEQSESKTEQENTKPSDFPSLLPISMKVAATTVSNNIVPVQPMGGYINEEELDRIEKRVKSENRDSKIDAIVENKKYTEKKLEDDPEFKELKQKGMPSGKLFYLDFNYDTKKHKKTRRSGKKHKKKNGK